MEVVPRDDAGQLEVGGGLRGRRAKPELNHAAICQQRGGQGRIFLWRWRVESLSFDPVKFKAPVTFDIPSQPLEGPLVHSSPALSPHSSLETSGSVCGIQMPAPPPKKKEKTLL